MKIMKRNGTEVVFDITKIIAAITKANNTVGEDARMTPVQIQRIAESVELSCQKMNRSPSVEEIQDLVESQIMAHGAYEVAKNYITYRYVRSLVRKSNTTDEKILSLIECCNEEAKQENSNKNPVVNSTQRDYMAGEVSRDLSERLLLPADIVEAHREGIIHFHDSDYYAQHMHNCDLVNLEDMLQNGTVITDTLIERPHSFSTACNIATQIIAQVASNQYGGQSISLAHLAPFVDVSRRKIRRLVEQEMEALGIQPTREKIEELVETRLRDEVRRGVQTIQYQVLTLLTTNGQAPFVTVFMYLGEAKNEQEKKDLALIIEETLEQRYQGVKNEKGVWITPAFPKLIYVLEEDNIHEDSPYWYLTKLAAKCTARRMVPDYISAKKMLELKGDVYTCMGCLLPDAGPLHRRRHRQHRQRRQLRARQAQVLRPVQPGRGDHQPAGRGPVLRRRSGQVLEDLRRAAGAVPPGPHVPPQPPEGHAVRRGAHPLAVRRLRPVEEGPDHRRAALPRLLHHLPGLCRPLRVRKVYDRQEPHRPRRHPLRPPGHGAHERRLQEVEGRKRHRLLPLRHPPGVHHL